ncbi:unnamed protein product [Durusdinium trenchii]|uniref:Uncharacterized protein n=1 Tax=Durusdinium trenchii TaxID=1381693 RepID=A0ABP0L3T7_9DINO
MTTLTELTVRQVGQVTPPLKQKIEQFQQIIDSNDQSVARLREHLRRLEPERERLSELVQQRQDDRRSIHSQLARLQDSLATFGAESAQLEAAAEEMPRILERIAVPSQPGDPNGFRRVPMAAIDVPLPYFDALAEQLEMRAEQVYDRVTAVEKALATYNRQVSGVPVSAQIEAVVRSEFLQFKAIAAELAQAGERLEQLRDAAVRTRGVPVGMLAQPIEDYESQRLAAARSNVGAGTLLGPLAMNTVNPAMMGCGGCGLMAAGANPAGGLFGVNTGAGVAGGLFNSGGGMFGQNTGGGLFGANTGGGMFGGQNTGGGLFGANTGGGMFGQNTGGGLFGANTGGGLFGANTGGGLF